MLQRKIWIFATLALAPILMIYAAVRLYPIGETLRLSLHQWNILSKNKPFIGLDNFRELIGDPSFLEALVNTTIIAFGVLIVTIPTALLIAALIYHRTQSRLAGFYETAVFLPHVVSLVPAAMLCAWQALGYAVLIYLVGFKNLPTSVYEAARLDGASGPQSFWYLSIPLLKPITLYVSVVTLVSGFNVYAQAFILASDSQGAPGRQVRVLVLDMLENSFRNYRVGYAASEAVVLLVIVLVLTLIQFTLLREKGGRA
jgi:multiple sugar transport system permease protein